MIVVSALVAAFGPAAGARAAGMEGLIMRGGKVMIVKDGKPMEPMGAATTLSDGATVAPDGAVRLPDGRKLRLHNGQVMMMDGTILSGGRPRAMMKPMGAAGGDE